jgi:hypothetical protein
VVRTNDPNRYGVVRSTIYYRLRRPDDKIKQQAPDSQTIQYVYTGSPGFVKIDVANLQHFKKLFTCLATATAISCEYPSRNSNFTSCNASDKLEIDKSLRTIEGPDVITHVRVFLQM